MRSYGFFAICASALRTLRLKALKRWVSQTPERPPRRFCRRTKLSVGARNRLHSLEPDIRRTAVPRVTGAG